MRYWLWIIPSREHGLWDFCCQAGVAAMEYKVGVDRNADHNRSLAQQIAVGDKIVAYLNRNRIGGVGTVTRPFFEDSTGYSSAKGELWAQRIGVTWQKGHEPLNVRGLPDVKAYLNELSPKLHTQTIHEIDADVYGQIAAAIRGKTLAEPFAQIFGSWEKAEWALTFLADVFARLGIHSADDPRLAVTLPRRYGGRPLHVNVGNWLILGFRGPGLSSPRVRIPVRADLLDWPDPPVEYVFTQDKDEPRIACYGLPLEKVRPMAGDLQSAYQSALEHIASRFQDRRGSLYRRYHQQQVAEAIFDPEKRERLLGKGLSSPQATPALPLVRRISDLLQTKPQVILQGAPGTGKTHTALLVTADILGVQQADARSTRQALQPCQLARLLEQDPSLADDPQQLAERVRATDQGLWDIVQMHPSYTYEDFVRGLRAEPAEGRVTFRAVNRTLGLMAETAQLLNGDVLPVVLILDEINRGDLSRVLGELIYALEYRDESVLTPYAVEGRHDMSLPPNFYLIGTMNTADRSIALIDYAIRRRFYFVTLRPDRNVIAEYYRGQPGLATQAVKLFDAVADLFRELQAGYDPRDLMVGHTYFMADGPESLALKFAYDIVPLLREYQREGLLESLSLKLDKVTLDLARGSQTQLLAQLAEWSKVYEVTG